MDVKCQQYNPMVAKKSFETGGASQATEKRGDSALQEKQERIIRAAKGVFLKYGYTRVTMSDLAQAAGMSRPVRQAARKPAQNASPAPVVSRTTADDAATRTAGACPTASKAPAAPSFRTTAP